MLDKLYWETLLTHIEGGQVIPIIGQDLMQVMINGRQVSLQHHLALCLADDFGIKADDRLLPDFTLTDLFAHPSFPRDKRTIAYARIKWHLDKTNAAPPESLRKLASIVHFSLFINMTFDSLLSLAINEARYDGAPKTQTVVYSNRDVRDLPPPAERGNAALVYQLFGEADSMPYYAVTEGDHLEFFHSLYMNADRLRNLTDVLDQRHLLFIGTGFPDWVSRFLLRFAKKDFFNINREFSELFADNLARRDKNFVAFVNQYSRQTLVYDEGSPEQFIDALYDNWRVLHPAPTGQTQQPLLVDPNGNPSAGVVFISYASEDREAARALSQQLTAGGLQVWFDQDGGLECGDDYPQKIRAKIRTCSIFLAVLSKSTSGTQPRFFRREWAWAIERLPEFTGTGLRFVQPVVVDNMSAYSAGLPEIFGISLHAVRAPVGALAPRDLQSIIDAAHATQKQSQVPA